MVSLYIARAFLVQGFFWVLLEALGIFLGLDFWLHSIIPVTWNPEYPPLGSKRGCLIERKRLKERGAYSHNCNRLNKTNMLSAKLSREFWNSGISTLLIDTPRSSRDPYRSFKSGQHRCQNPRSELLRCHRQSILALTFQQDHTQKASLSSKKLNNLNDFASYC